MSLFYGRTRGLLTEPRRPSRRSGRTDVQPPYVRRYEPDGSGTNKPCVGGQSASRCGAAFQPLTTSASPPARLADSVSIVTVRFSPGSRLKKLSV